MKQNEYLNELSKRLDRLKKRVESSFYYLDEEVLNYKPHEKSWSISQCIEHLNLTNESYLKQFKKVGELAGSEVIDKPFYHSLKGRFFINSMTPKTGDRIKYKMPTAAQLRPLAEKQPGAKVLVRVVFEDFMRDIDDLKEQLEHFKNIDIRKVKIKTLFGSMVKLSVGDALGFIIAHMDRHILQAEKVKQHSS